MASSRISEVFDCPLGCGDVFPEEDLKDHEENGCQKRMVSCTLCAKQVIEERRPVHERDECSHRIIRCSCGFDLRACDKETHENEACPLTQGKPEKSDSILERLRRHEHPASLGVSMTMADIHTFHPASVQAPPKDAVKASQVKAEGNALYAQQDFAGASGCYYRALELCPHTQDCDYSRAVFHNNLAACLLNMGRYEEVLDHCDAAIELQPRYVKALMRRAQAFEKLDQLEDAIKDLDACLEIDPSIINCRRERERVAAALTEQQEKMKEEMLSKLKGLGNTVLGKFGMSLDNFQVQQDPSTGSYSINFKQ